jgi:hypothetical protein
MIPGPAHIYQCPNCGKYLKNRSLRSGNTFGAQLFSDGKRIAPMLPDFPNLTKCKKCNSIFWLSNLKEIGIYDYWDSKNLEWENADWVDFLGIKDLYRALEITKNKKEETIIRQQIWWTFNDRVRAGKEIFIEENDSDLWEQNCSLLLNLFDKNDVNQQIMIAELFRNLGRFEHCMELINSLSNNFDWLKKQFKIECTNKNTKVFALKYN